MRSILVLSVTTEREPGAEPPHTHMAVARLSGRLLASAWGPNAPEAEKRCIDLLAERLRGDR